MIKVKLNIYCLPVALISMLAFGFKPSVSGIEKKKGSPLSDTTSFTANSAGGWSILSCYLNQDTPDSVEFELILKQTNPPDWRSEQFIGTINNTAFIPQQPQASTFYLLFNNIWHVRVLPNGQCFFNLTEGPPPPGSPVYLPFKVKYKNN